MSEMYSLVSVNHVFGISLGDYQFGNARILMTSSDISALEEKMHQLFEECLNDESICELNGCVREYCKTGYEDPSELGAWLEEPDEAEMLDYVYKSSWAELTHCEVFITPHDNEQVDSD